MPSAHHHDEAPLVRNFPKKEPLSHLQPLALWYSIDAVILKWCNIFPSSLQMRHIRENLIQRLSPGAGETLRHFQSETPDVFQTGEQLWGLEMCCHADLIWYLLPLLCLALVRSLTFHVSWHQSLSLTLLLPLESLAYRGPCDGRPDDASARQTSRSSFLIAPPSQWCSFALKLETFISGTAHGEGLLTLHHFLIFFFLAGFLLFCLAAVIQICKEEVKEAEEINGKGKLLFCSRQSLRAAVLLLRGCRSQLTRPND